MDEAIEVFAPPIGRAAWATNSILPTFRDFALLMMEAARSLGFAARFVTGYVYVAIATGRFA